MHRQIQRVLKPKAEWVLAVVLSLALAVSFSAQTHAAPGDLDPTFGTGGKVTTQFPVRVNSSGYSVAMQPDGKLVVVGEAGDGFALTRLTPDGNPDPSFSEDGRVVTGFSDYADRANAVAIQPDGKIVAAGFATTFSGNKDVALARYNIDGSLDASFGTAGKVVTNLNGANDEAFALVIQPDGKIVAAGVYSDYFALVRYQSDGTLDSSFGTGGKVFTSFSGTMAIGYAVALQGDGKVVVAGRVGTASYDFALVRYNTNGSVDTSFGTNGNGKVITDFANSDEVAYSILIQPDGKLVAGGYGRPGPGTSGDFALTRYNSDGTLDESFGTGGKVLTDFTGVNDIIRSLKLQADGKIVAAGYKGTIGDFALARYNTDGTLDESFATGGKALTDFGGNDTGAGVAVRGDGRILVAGASYIANLVTSDFALASYGPDGSPDLTFGQGGKLRATITLSSASIQGIALQADGKIVAAGYAAANFALARYNTSGTLDSSFGGGGGTVTTAVGEGGSGINAVTLQGDGKIVVAGHAVTSQQSDFAVARYNNDGTLDHSFGASGIVTTSTILGNDGAYAVAIQPDGKIVSAGTTGYHGGGDFALVRYNADGTLDPGFGTGGIVTNYFGSGSQVRSLLIQPDGKILAVGGGGGGSFTLARYNQDGNLDPSFGSGGVITTSFTGFALARSARLLEDGKILVAGQAGPWPPADFALAQYYAGGSLDATFGAGGRVVTDFASENDEAHGVGLLLGGKIVAGGPTGFKLAGYNSDGSLDSLFGNGGKVVTSVGDGSSVEAIEVQGDARVLAAGSALIGSDRAFALARYMTSNEETQPALVGHVTWQGPPPQPHLRQQLPITLTLALNNSEVNYPVQTTDASGYFTVSLASLPTGAYTWRVKGPKFLANAGTVNLTGVRVTNQEMGVMRAGDANNDNSVSSVDFAILRSTFGLSSGQSGYDDRADFTGDGVVNAADFTLLRTNFGQGGALPAARNRSKP